MKGIGCVMVILSSAGIGFYFSSEMKSRIEDLKELKKLIGLLKGDIRYGNTPLPEAISAIAGRYRGSFRSFFCRTSARLMELSGQTFTEIWKNAVEQELVKTSLSKKDRLALISFGENLGYLDKDMQMNTFELYLSQLEEEIGELTRTVKERSYLYNSLGIMAGVFISIVMI
ncbi:stage III sporulation protein AB [Anaerotaenia torta]|uniref:stage III sporulation protein AB n=1 Tax=Anaerotaenia torta TaxID=433293 RepID=UPI003D23D17D